MNRKKELANVFKELDEQNIIRPMIDDVVFLEAQLKELKKLPFIRVNPDNPAEQKPTAAAKQYKEFLQQYNNCIKILISVLNKNEVVEDSPLRQFLKEKLK
jgi:deoxyadenosine/deoxycytidine kinase